MKKLSILLLSILLSLTSCYTSPPVSTTSLSSMSNDQLTKEYKYLQSDIRSIERELNMPLTGEYGRSTLLNASASASRNYEKKKKLEYLRQLERRLIDFDIEMSRRGVLPKQANPISEEIK